MQKAIYFKDEKASENNAIISFFENNEKKINAFQNFIERYTQGCKDDYKTRFGGNNTFNDMEYKTAFVGKKYIKICDYRAGSVECFVDNQGNIYKASGWNSPANGVRYYITDNIHFDSCTGWTYGNRNLVPLTNDNWI